MIRRQKVYLAVQLIFRVHMHVPRELPNTVISRWRLDSLLLGEHIHFQWQLHLHRSVSELFLDSPESRVIYIPHTKISYSTTIKIRIEQTF